MFELGASLWVVALPCVFCGREGLIKDLLILVWEESLLPVIGPVELGLGLTSWLAPFSKSVQICRLKIIEVKKIGQEITIRSLSGTEIIY